MSKLADATEVEKTTLTMIKQAAMKRLNQWLEASSEPFLETRKRIEPESGLHERIMVLQQAAVERRLGLLDEWKYQRVVSRFQEALEPGYNQIAWGKVFEQVEVIAKETEQSFPGRMDRDFTRLKRDLRRWSSVLAPSTGRNDEEDDLNTDARFRRKFSGNRSR